MFLVLVPSWFGFGREILLLLALSSLLSSSLLTTITVYCLELRRIAVDDWVRFAMAASDAASKNNHGRRGWHLSRR